jgi:hypothetical protein
MDKSEMKEIRRHVRATDIAHAKKLDKELENMRAQENSDNFNKAMKVVDKVGQEIGEMREWAPYCNDPSTYMPFPVDILKLTQQQMLHLLIHAYGTALHLKDKLDEVDTNGWGVNPNEDE